MRQPAILARVDLYGGPPFGSTRARLAGCRTALQEAGVAHDPLLETPGGFVPETGYEAARDLLRLSEPPTAIFAGSDLQAMGVYRALYELGLRVPDDVSVVGFDDIQLAPLLTPALTTIRQPVREMGALATRMLLRLIAEETLESSRVELATSLVVRESSAAPRT